MTTFRAAATAAMGMATAILAGALCLTTPAMAAFDAPWKDDSRALVIDAYEFNPINWQQLTSDKRIAGFINKASDGLPPEWNCGGTSGDDYKLCKNRWWKYSVTKELYLTRREMAKMKGLKWGAYHLGRPGNPREQADHFVDFAEPEPDDLIAIDIEDRGDEWMSLSDAEIFADQIKVRTGRYPVLYTNGSTAKYVSDNAADYPLLSRLQLWYARYRQDITGRFPEETWPTYALWQFSSMHNCDSRSCPYRVKGAKTDIDVNVSTMDVAGLKKAWPFDGLVERKPSAPRDPAMLIASLDDKTRAGVAAAAGRKQPSPEASAAAVPGTLAAAYGPSGGTHAAIDPLKLLSEVADEERAAHRSMQALAALFDVNPELRRTIAAAPKGKAAAVKPASSEGAVALDDHLSALKDVIAVATRQIEKLIVGPAEASTRIDEPRANKSLPDKLTTLRGRHRSRFMTIMEEAMAAKKAGALAMPARILSQLGPDGSDRRDRVVGKSDRYAGLDFADRRIFTAFDTTR